MADNSKLEIFKLISKRYTFREVAILKCGLDEAQVNDNQIFRLFANFGAHSAKA